MGETIRWGVIGTGSICRKFAEGLTSAAGAELVAVGSRAADTAEAFGEKFGVARRHASYEALAADGEVDAVYIGTPHPFHKANAILCLTAGKAVLCEKPFAINAGEAAEAIETARREKVFLMEAMWSRFLPATVRTRELIADGAIGEVRMLIADFAFRAGWNPQSRLLDPALGGGGLLDVGVYTVSLASMLLGTPVDVASAAHLGETGVDEQAGMVLRYAGGQLAVLACGVRIGTEHEAMICGTEGRIRLHKPWWRGQKMTVIRGGDEEVIEAPFEGNGYNYEAEEVGRCLQAGKTESDVMPLDETLAIIKTLDKMRAQWGLKYPME